jgi:hypothetical protein
MCDVRTDRARLTYAKDSVGKSSHNRTIKANVALIANQSNPLTNQTREKRREAKGDVCYGRGRMLDVVLVQSRDRFTITEEYR